MAGRRDEALERSWAPWTQMARIPTFHIWTSYLHAWLDRRVPDMLEVREALSSLKVMEDPEAIFQEGWLLCDVGEFERGLEHCTAPSTRATTWRRCSRADRSSTPSVTEPAFQADARDGARRPRATRSPHSASRRRASPRTTMKTLARACDKAEIVRRLKTISPDSPRRWGRMSAHQMICHLSDSFLARDRPAPGEPGHGTTAADALKWFALYGRSTGRGGIRPDRRVDQQQGGTRPIDFASRHRAARDAGGDDHDARPRCFHGRQHPIFGPMSESAWMRWAYLHMDHHLRQFGC